MESKKDELIETESRMVFSRAGGWPKRGDVVEGCKLSVMTNRFWEPSAQHGDCS